MALPAPGAGAGAGLRRIPREELVGGMIIGAMMVIGDELNSRIKQIYNALEKPLKGWGDVALSALVSAVMYVLAGRVGPVTPYAEEFLEAIVAKLIYELDKKYGTRKQAFFYIDESASKLVLEGSDGEGVVCIDSGKTSSGAGDNGCRHVTLSGGTASVNVSLTSGTSFIMFVANDGKWYARVVPWKVVYA